MTEQTRNEVVEEQEKNTTVNDTTKGVNDTQNELPKGNDNPNDNQDNGLPKSKEELDKLLQSTSSKAKNELLKEIGLNKVSDIKELLDKGYKYDDIVKESEELKGNYSNLKKEIIKRDNDALISTHNIPETSRDIFIKLVDEMEGDMPREEKAIKVKEQLAGITGGVDKLGSGKTTTNEENHTQKLKKIMGL